jgi:hypothetical protein
MSFVLHNANISAMGNTVLAVASCVIAVTYVWLLPYITEFSSPVKRKLKYFSFNESEVFSHYNLYHLDNNEYTVFLHQQVNNTRNCFVSSAYDRVHFLHKNVTSHFKFNLKPAPYTAVRITCQNEQQFIFKVEDTSVVFPLMPKDNQTFISLQNQPSVYDISKSLRKCMIENFLDDAFFRVYVMNPECDTNLQGRILFH